MASTESLIQLHAIIDFVSPAYDSIEGQIVLLFVLTEDLDIDASKHAPTLPQIPSNVLTSFDFYAYLHHYSCYEAVKNLKSALEAGDSLVDVEFHPYFLGEDDLKELETRSDFARIAEAAASKASMNAHRLLLFVKQREPSAQLQLVLAILKAFHEEEKQISSVEELLALSASHAPGVPSNLVQMFLQDGNLATLDVTEEAEENAGPSGTPFFIFGRRDVPKRKIVFSGAQDVETISTAIKNLSL